MRTYLLPVRITRTKRCPEGFYLLCNGQRIHFKKRSAAIESIDAILALQRIQVVTVREYAERRKVRGVKLAKPPTPDD